MKTTDRKNNEVRRHRIISIIGIVLCVLLIPILVINLTLIVKSWTAKDEVPTFAGVFPMVVLTDSMEGVINSGDLIICHTIKAEDVKVKDIISFFDPEGNGSSVVTHRVEEITEKNGKIYFITKGDANNTRDREPVPADSLIGIYKMRIPGAGRVAMFMQTTPGLLVCVGVPLILLVGADLLRRRKYEQTQQQDTDALLAELEALKAEKAKAQAERATEEQSSEVAEKDDSSGQTP